MGQPSVENTAEHYEVVVIGAGQAGLAMGYFLSRQKRRFLIVERAGSVGSAWRERWDSLTLFTSRRYDSLPGLDFPGDPAGYPNKDEVIGYLEEYARRFELPVSLNTNVRRLGVGESEGYVIETDRGTIGADQVVVATGPFQQPFVPAVADATRTRDLSSSQRPVPKAVRSTGGNDPRRRGRKHWFPDRGRTVLDSRPRRSRGRFATDAPSPESPGSRPLLVADQEPSDQQDRRVSAR